MDDKEVKRTGGMEAFITLQTNKKLMKGCERKPNEQVKFMLIQIRADSDKPNF